MKYICPVCGYVGFDEPPFDADGISTFDICPCCGLEFGNRDGVRSLDELPERHAELTAEWAANGMQWRHGWGGPPTNWDPIKQLENLKYVLTPGATREQYLYPESK